MSLLRMFVLVVLVMVGCVFSIAEEPRAPLAPQKDHVSVWHGEKQNDPWYWLREKDTPDVLAYLNAENDYTAAMTAGLKPFADTLYQEILGRIKQTDLSVPWRLGRYYYYNRTVEGQQYPIYCRKAAAADLAYNENAPEEILLDQNEMAKGHKFMSLFMGPVNRDEQTLLFCTDTTGFRLYSLYVKDLVSGQLQGPLADRVTGFEWAAAKDIVFFVTEDAVTKRSDTLWRLKFGEEPVRIYHEADALFTLDLRQTKDRRMLVLTSGSTDSWESRLLDVDKPYEEFKVVLTREKGHKYSVEHRDGRLLIRTNKEAKNFRLVSASLDDPQPQNWQPIVEHRDDTLLSGINVFRDFLVVSEQVAGLVRLRMHAFADQSWQTISFPEPAYTAYAAGNPEFDSSSFRYGYQSFITPSSIYEFDMKSGQSILLKAQEVLGGYDPGRYTSERLWATARDGVRVPVSIVYRKGLKRDGSAPLWLYAYGSYGYGSSASFNSGRLSLLDRGVVFAIAHIRGGNEMGEAWHDDGMLMKKKNTFFDFIDCAEYLIKEKWTTSRRLVIEGGSAGGLLMGAVVNYRPDLFKAVHAAVPFVDVMNTMMDDSLPLTVQEYLEWGNPNEKAAFDYMHSYSPYDNLKKGEYPAILVTTSYNDSQVMYWEPAKYVAKLRTLKTDKKPLHLKINMDPAGHGGASGRYDALRDRAFEMAWMLSQVGILK